MVKPGVNVKVTWILCLLFISANEAAKCLQDAQRQCQDQSAGLIEARQGGEVCRAYADYDSCIKTSINKLGCRLLPSEADLHETDITNVYTKPPYGCTKTDSGWIASLTARSLSVRLIAEPTLCLLLALSRWM